MENKSENRNRKNVYKIQLMGEQKINQRDVSFS